MNEPLSVTAWPGPPVPERELARWPKAELDGEFIYLLGRSESAQPPPEFYLRHARRTEPAEDL